MFYSVDMYASVGHFQTVLPIGVINWGPMMSRFHCTTFMTLEILPVILLSGSAGGSDKSGLLIVVRNVTILSVLECTRPIFFVFACWDEKWKGRQLPRVEPSLQCSATELTHGSQTTTNPHSPLYGWQVCN